MEATAEITAAVKNVPALRFPEFGGEWKENRLGEGVKLVSGQHLGPGEYNTLKDGVPYFTGPSDFTGEESQVTKWTNNSKHFGKICDILITVKGSGVGTMTLLQLQKVAMGRQLMAIKSGDFNAEFVYHFLLTKKNLFVALASGNMIPGLSRQDILTLKLKVPSPRTAKDSFFPFSR
jgi:type I restriction enzyme, S subunit